MQPTKPIVALLALTICVCPCYASGPTDISFNSGQIVLEAVGQVNNTGSNSVQFGYASKVAGIGNAFSNKNSRRSKRSHRSFYLLYRSREPASYDQWSFNSHCARGNDYLLPQLFTPPPSLA